MKKRWWYLINNFLIMLVGGTIYSYSILRKPIEEYLNISPSQSYLPFKVLLFLFAFSMPLSGYLIEKINAKRTYILAALLLSFSWISSHFITSLNCFVISYGVIGGIGTGLIYGVPLYITSRWFRDKKGLATGITVAGFGFSTFLASFVLKSFILKYGVINAFLYFGLLIFIILFICYFNVKEPEYQEDNFQENLEGVSTKEIFYNKFLYLLFFSFTFACSVSLTAVSFTAPYFIDFFSFEPKKAAYMVSIMALFNTLGRPFYGYFTDRFGFYKALVLSVFKYLVASFFLLFYSNNLVLSIIAFTFLWLNLGGWLAIAPVATLKTFGLKHYSQNYGIVYTAYGIGAFLGMSIVSNFDYKFFYVYIILGSLILMLIGLKNIFKGGFYVKNS